jgi:Ca-activated chloride channel family protein
MRRSGLALALAFALALLAGACTHEDPSADLDVQDPGRCTPVDVAATVDTAPALATAARAFNDSPAARLAGGCAFVRVEVVDAPAALRDLATEWPNAARLGPAPTVWVPPSSAWAALLNARPMPRDPVRAGRGVPILRDPVVVAMPAVMAHALGYPKHPITWTALARLAADRRGWGAAGHPEWGRFRLGAANPNWAPSALASLMARPPALEPALERAVVYFGDTADAYFDNWARLAQTSTRAALAYLSAAVTDERAFAAKAPASKLPLVAIRPPDGRAELDNPMYVLDAAWTTRDAQAGAHAFIGFVRRTTAARAAVAGATVAHALARWQATRRRARVEIVFDTSDSMGDAADPFASTSPTKIALARPALAVALAQLAPDDEIGLRTLTTELVPIGRYRARQKVLTRAVAALQPGGGSPLYRATQTAFDDVARHAESARINAVILLTDGYNEDDHDNNLNALLAHLASVPEVHVFPIVYSNDADLATLRRIAQATDGQLYDARDTSLVADDLARALANVA